MYIQRDIDMYIYIYIYTYAYTHIYIYIYTYTFACLTLKASLLDLRDGPGGLAPYMCIYKRCKHTILI